MRRISWNRFRASLTGLPLGFLSRSLNKSARIREEETKERQRSESSAKLDGFSFVSVVVEPSVGVLVSTTQQMGCTAVAVGHCFVS